MGGLMSLPPGLTGGLLRPIPTAIIMLKPVPQTPSYDMPETTAATSGYRRMFVRDLTMLARIGVYAHEKDAAQRVRISLDLMVREGSGPLHDRLDEVVCYDTLARSVRAVVADGHVNLVETLAERIAERCFDDARVRSARITIEKLDVMPDTGGVGVEILRYAPGS